MRSFILGCNDYMCDSETGEIISLKNGKTHVLKQVLSNKGYYQVQLSWHSKYKHYFVHRLIWEAFNGPIPKGMVINHKDEIKTNNALSNLELCTHQYNIMYGTARKRMVEKRSMPVRQFIEDTYIDYPSAAEAGRQTGIAQGNISKSCKTGGYAGGYKWIYLKNLK